MSYMQARRENISGIRLRELESTSTKRLRELTGTVEEVRKEIHEIKNNCNNKLKALLRDIPLSITYFLKNSDTEWEQVRDVNNIAIALDEAVDIANSYDNKENAARILTCMNKLYEKLGLDIRRTD